MDVCRAILGVGSVDGSLAIFSVRQTDGGLVAMIKMQTSKTSPGVPVSSVSLKSMQESRISALIGCIDGSIFSTTFETTSHSASVDIVSHAPSRPISDILVIPGRPSTGRRLIATSGDVIFNSFDDGLNWLKFSTISGNIACIDGNGVILVAGVLGGNTRAGSSRIVGIDGKTGSQVWTIIIDFGQIFKLCISPSSSAQLKTVIVGLDSGEVCLYDLRTKQMRWKIRECISGITGINVFNTDYGIFSGGRSLVTFFVGDVASMGKRTLTHHRERNLGINAHVLFSNHSTVITTGGDCNFVYWDLRVRDCIRVVPTNLSSEITAMALWESEERSIIATGDSTGIVRVLNVVTGEWLNDGRFTRHSGRVTSIAWIDGQKFISGAVDNCLILHELHVRMPGRCELADDRNSEDVVIRALNL
jgi:WD40 repeat protein